MNFDADKKTIATLLNCKKKFEIPRFQREYSWEKPQLKEFFEDIVSRVHVAENGELTTTEYFWGTTLFVGSFTDATCKSLQVVDGQQRLTTITIFLSCIRKAFLNINNTKLAETTQSYIMSKDDNGDNFAILVNETPYPYFQNVVQAENASGAHAVSDEENNIKNAVDYFSVCLKRDRISKFFNDKFGAENQFEIADIYKVIRDQLLNSVIIAVSTQDKNQANMIFEILNAKGKSLDQLDLIKNQIFSVMKSETPSDEAKVLWKKIKDKLYSRAMSVDMSVFFNHYWASKYKHTTYKKLYEQFKSVIKKTENAYMGFLEDLLQHADYYLKITNPNLSDFDNKIEFRNVYYYLCFLNDINIRQSRILILALFDMRKGDNSLISTKAFVKCLQNLCIFHLIYNGLYSQGTNILEKLYSTTANALRTLNSREEVNQKLGEMYAEMGKSLNRVVSKYNVLFQSFEGLKYSAKINTSDNPKAKFFLRMNYELSAAYPTDASIEHIANEDAENSYTLMVGNLIPLEAAINNSIPKTADFSAKVNNSYINSNYPMVKEFVDQYHDQNVWGANEIKTRTNAMAKKFCEYYLTDFKLNLE